MKTYVKPMMESEAFVANEYVAACYEITCTGTHYYNESFFDPHSKETVLSCGSERMQLDSDPEGDYWDSNNDGFVTIVVEQQIGLSDVYNGIINGTSAKHSYTYKILTVDDGYGPNAS